MCYLEYQELNYIYVKGFCSVLGELETNTNNSAYIYLDDDFLYECCHSSVLWGFILFFYTV